MLPQPWLMLPESSLSSAVPVDSPLLPSWCLAPPATSGAPGRFQSKVWPHSSFTSPGQSLLLLATGREPTTFLPSTYKERWEKRGAWIPAPAAGPGEARSWWWHREGKTFLFQLCSCFLGETLALKLCAAGEVTSVPRQGDDGEEEGRSEGKRVPHFSAQRSLIPASAVGASGCSLWAQATGPLPVPPLVLASLAGHLPQQKSRERRRKDGGIEASSSPACRFRWESAAGHGGQGGEVEERLSKRGGLGSFPSPQSALGRVSS